MSKRNYNEDADFILKAFLTDEKLLRHIKKKVHSMRQDAKIVHKEDLRFLVNRAIDAALVDIGIQDLIKAYFAGRKKPHHPNVTHGSPSHSTGSRRSQTSGSSHASKTNRQSQNIAFSKKTGPSSPENKNKLKSKKLSNSDRKTSGSSLEKAHGVSSGHGGGNGKFDFTQTYRFSPEDFQGLAVPMQQSSSSSSGSEGRRQRQQPVPERGAVGGYGNSNGHAHARRHHSHDYAEYDDIGGPQSFTSGTTVTAVTSAAISPPSSSPHSSHRYSNSSPDEEEQDTEEAFYPNEFDEIIASPDPFGLDSSEGMSGKKGVAGVGYSPFPLPSERESHDSYVVADGDGDREGGVVEGVGRDLHDEPSLEPEGNLKPRQEVLEGQEEQEQEQREGAGQESSIGIENEEAIMEEVDQLGEQELSEELRRQKEEQQEEHHHEEEVEVEVEEEEPEGDYSMGDFESPSHSPARVARTGEGGGSKRVVFPDDVVASTLFHRMKYVPAETAELFYTQDEAMQFQYDYDREVTRAENANLDWYEWIMTRSEEQQLADEEEDAAMEQEAYSNYWEEQEQEESDNSNEFW
jgi:hypothetical protein